MRRELTNLKGTVARRLQPLFYKWKISRFCKKALNGLDSKIEKYINFKNGVFVEAGANDGINQSNTYYLEAIKGWRGILIEPVPALHKQCRENRPNSTCLQTALVSHDYQRNSIELEYANLMTMVSDKSGNVNYNQKHIKRGRWHIPEDERATITSPAETLDSILTRLNAPKVDLLILDLEGYEIEALKGLDFSKNGPQWLLLEVRDLDAITAILGKSYELIATLSDCENYKDILFKKI